MSSAEPLLQTESVTQGGLITGLEVSQLPLATNNFTQLLALSPGVIAPLNDATGLGRGTQNVNVNGARTSSNSIYVDGVDAINVHTNSAANNGFASNSTVIPPPDAIQEIKIQTALFDASTGRSGGSNVALITHTGANQFHGSIYEFFRNTIFDANSYFLKQQGQPRPELLQNQFGGSLGGPIKKDKIFFFFNYQGTRQVNGYPGITSLSLPQIPQTRTAAAIGAWASTLGATSHGGPAIAANGSNISPVALALLLCLLRPRQLSWRILAWLGVAGLLPFAFQNSHYVSGQYDAWLQTRLADNRFDYPMKDAPLDLWYLLVRVGRLPVSERAYTALQVICGAAIAALVLLQSRRRLPQRDILANLFLMVSAWMLLLGPATENQTYVVLAPAACLAAVQSLTCSSCRTRLFALSAVTLLLAAVGRNSLFPHIKSPVEMTIQPIAALLLLAAILMELRITSEIDPGMTSVPTPGGPR